jgi:hypothetical protein
MSHSRSGSAAHIVTKPRDPLSGLRRLIEACGSNKHDQAITLITACLGDGVNTAPEIIAVGTALGLNPAHVAIILRKDAGSSPDRHRWRRDEQGTYSLLN